MSARALFLYPVLLVTGISVGLAASNVACNSYDLLIHDHFAQASFSNRVDILWQVDSSNSMAGNQANLQTSFDCFINQLAGSGGQTSCDTDTDCPAGGTCNPCGYCDVDEEPLELNTLSDAIDVYEQFLGNRTQFLNYQMGVTTSQATPCANDPDAYAGCEDSVGNTGRLRSLANAADDVSHPPTFLYPDSETLVEDFKNLVNVGVDGSNVEYGFWVSTLAICASLDLPFDSDFTDWGSDTLFTCSGTNWDLSHPWAPFCRCLPQEFYDYNVVVDENGDERRFLRDNSTLVVIAVTDEGDSTPHLGTAEWPWADEIEADCVIGEPWPVSVQEQCENATSITCENYCKIEYFLDFYESIDRRVVFAVMGPGAELNTDQQGNVTLTSVCNDQNSSPQELEFYLWGAELTNGMYAPIDVPISGDTAPCEDADFNQALSDLGRLVSNLSSGWHLSTVPDLGTVSVFIQGLEVPPAECDPEYDECPPEEPPTCTGSPSAGLNGWTYDESAQSIQFHGDCIPDFNQVVDIYYLPLSGGGRPLPF